MRTPLSLILMVLTLAACAGGAPLRDGPRPTAKLADDHPYCLRETGSRIRGQCAHGQSISDEELESTGGFGLGDRLRRRVPGLR